MSDSTSRTGWVYFIQHGATVSGAIKIGTTQGNPYARLRALQTGAPEPLRLLAAIDGGPLEERALHQRFAAHRLRADGEWFAASAELLAFIEGARWGKAQPEDEGQEEDHIGVHDMAMVTAFAVNTSLIVAEANGTPTPWPDSLILRLSIASNTFDVMRACGTLDLFRKIEAIYFFENSEALLDRFIAHARAQVEESTEPPVH